MSDKLIKMRGLWLTDFVQVTFEFYSPFLNKFWILVKKPLFWRKGDRSYLVTQFLKFWVLGLEGERLLHFSTQNFKSGKHFNFIFDTVSNLVIFDFEGESGHNFPISRQIGPSCVLILVQASLSSLSFFLNQIIQKRTDRNRFLFIFWLSISEELFLCRKVNLFCCHCTCRSYR